MEVLRMVDIVKEFPGVRALDRVNLSACRGEILALVGENGAGKSTLMKVLSGVWPYGSYEGELYIKDALARFDTPRDAEQAGIAIIHQELNLVPHLTVAENVFLNRPLLSRWGMIDRERMHARTAELLRTLGLSVNPEAVVGTLTVGKQQLVEIAKALSVNAEVLILDEPTSALSDREVADLFEILRQLKAQGVAMIYISHKMDELDQIADKVAVLRDGASIGSAQEIKTLPKSEIIHRMVGRKIDDMYPSRPERAGGQSEDASPVLSVQNFSVMHPMLPGEKQVDDVSFDLHPGEILGLTGLMGAGRTELVEGIFGAIPGRAEGEVLLKGAPLRAGHPKDAIEAGIGLVTEDRKLFGLVLGMTVRENATLSVLAQLTRRFAIDRAKEQAMVDGMIERLNIKTPSAEERVMNLSGGNQQKVVLAKWLLTKPTVLVLDEPTRGVDVGAKVEIYQIMNTLVAQGVAIIMISSELPEIMGMSDRVMVMREGKQVAMLKRGEATEEEIMSYAATGEALGVCL